MTGFLRKNNQDIYVGIAKQMIDLIWWAEGAKIQPKVGKIDRVLKAVEMSNNLSETLGEFVLTSTDNLSSALEEIRNKNIQWVKKAGEKQVRSYARIACFLVSAPEMIKKALDSIKENVMNLFTTVFGGNKLPEPLPTKGRVKAVFSKEDDHRKALKKLLGSLDVTLEE